MSNHEKFDFGEPVSRKNTEMEQYVAGVMERNPGVAQKRDELIEVLNSTNFDTDHFKNIVREWEEKTKREKGFEGQSFEIERIKAKNGNLKLYHFRESDSVMFGYSFT